MPAASFMTRTHSGKPCASLAHRQLDLSALQQPGPCTNRPCGRVVQRVPWKRPKVRRYPLSWDGERRVWSTQENVHHILDLCETCTWTHAPFELRRYDRSLPFWHQAKAAVLEICHSTKRPASSAHPASCEDSAVHMAQANQGGQTAKGFR